MSISFLSVLSNVQLYCGRLIISFHPSSDLLTTTTSRVRLFSPLVANQAVVHLWRRSILCNFPLRANVYTHIRIMETYNYGPIHTCISIHSDTHIGLHYSHIYAVKQTYIGLQVAWKHNMWLHWRQLVKNMGATKILGERCTITDEIIGFLNYWGHVARLPQS